MKHGVQLSNGPGLEPDEALELAILAEEAGWDGVFVSDSIQSGYSDPWTLLGAIAARTTRVTLGTWITPVPHQLPWRLAHTLASLDQLSDGRVLLGAGLGVRQEYAMFGEEYDAPTLGRRYDEALEVMAGLWTGEPFSYDGEFYTLEEAVLPVTPVQQPRIPIVIAGWWPNRAPFRRAARWDGVMPAWPALLGDSTGPEGQRSRGLSVEEELRELLAHYHGEADDPGEVVVPRSAALSDELAAELGVTWLLTSGVKDADDLREGPLR